jgi:pimeloyl-ACP methyl ester carboxylesterase
MNSPRVERAFVWLDEGQVHLRRLIVPDADQPPIFLLHASPSSSRASVPLGQALAATGRSVIMPDTLGNGDSAPPAESAPDVAYFARSMLRLADALEIDRFDVYGAHTGARIACELAAIAPDRVRGAVLDGIKEYDAATRETILAHYAPKHEPDDHGTHLVWAFHFVRDQALYFPHFQRDPAHRLPGFMPPARALHESALDVLKALDTYALPYLAAFRYRALERLAQIERPVLLLKAERELAVLNAAVEEAAAMLKHGQVAAIASDPSAKAQAIAAFLDGVDD